MTTQKTVQFTSTNTTAFRKKMVEHVLSFYPDETTKEGKAQALESNARACFGKSEYGFSAWQAGTKLAGAGEFLVAYHEVDDLFKNELGMTKEKYKDEDRNMEARWELYLNLCGKAVRDVIENTNKLLDKAELENME